MFYHKKRTVNPTLARTKLSLSAEPHTNRHYFQIEKHIFHRTEYPSKFFIPIIRSSRIGLCDERQYITDQLQRGLLTSDLVR